jgi:hypothetical protein
LGIPEGVNLEAFDFYGSDILFSVDVPLILDGKSFTEKDIILYEGSTFSKILNGADVGIPEGAQMYICSVNSKSVHSFSQEF